MPPLVYTPICPHTLLCICVFLEALHVVGVVIGSPLCWDTSLTPPLFGGASPSSTPHTHSFPVHWYVSGISVCYVGISLLLKGLGVWGHQHLRCPYAHSCTFVFVVHYVSHCNYGSDYYSSSYSSIFWPVISDNSSFLDRLSSECGSAWHGSTTTLDAERLWRSSWFSFCATAVNSIFNASPSLCQLCYGFSTGRFLFQS